MPTPLIITTDSDTIRLAGGLDLYSVENARTELLACFGARRTLVLDLDKVSDCDAAGWQLLLALRQTAIAAGKNFSFGAGSAVVEECRQLLGIPVESCQPHTI